MIWEAPGLKTKLVPISQTVAQSLAYYGAANDLGVLAPRGWHCYGSYGSGGQHLFVTPQPIDHPKTFAPAYRGFDGPVIEISIRRRDQFGDRLQKAQIIARVFPAHKARVKELMEAFDTPASEYPFGPYPSDILTYKSQSVVEYKTPPQTEGLGTHSMLKKSDRPIEGVAILSGAPPDLIHLSIRLPEALQGLGSVIIQQLEREVAAR